MKNLLICRCATLARVWLYSAAGNCSRVLLQSPELLLFEQSVRMQVLGKILSFTAEHCCFMSSYNSAWDILGWRAIFRTDFCHAFAQIQRLKGFDYVSNSYFCCATFKVFLKCINPTRITKAKNITFLYFNPGLPK